MTDDLIVNSLEFATQKHSVTMNFQGADLVELLDSIVEQPGQITATVVGNTRRDEKPYLDVSIVGVLTLECQRCLETLNFEINSQSRFIIAPTENDLTDVSDESDNTSSILAEREFDLRGFVQGEMLLSLPMSPMHETGSCVRPHSTLSDDDVTNPFRVQKG